MIIGRSLTKRLHTYSSGESIWLWEKGQNIFEVTDASRIGNSLKADIKLWNAKVPWQRLVIILEKLFQNEILVDFLKGEIRILCRNTYADQQSTY